MPKKSPTFKQGTSTIGGTIGGPRLKQGWGGVAREDTFGTPTSPSPEEITEDNGGTPDL